MVKEINRVWGEGVQKSARDVLEIDWISLVEDSGLWKRIVENKPRRMKRDLILENLKFQPEDFGLLSVGSGTF